METAQITEDSLHAPGAAFYGFFVRNPGADVMVLLFRKGSVGGDIIGGATLSVGGTMSLSLVKPVSTNGVYVEKVSGTGTAQGCIYYS